MKVSMKLTMDGLVRSLSTVVRKMADETDWRYADPGDSASRPSTPGEREMARTDRHELGGN